jgi:hypothetical protein
VVQSLKKSWAAFAFLSVLAISVMVIASPMIVGASPSNPFDVEVDHVVEIRDSGLLVVNETVTLSSNPGDVVEPLENYVLGFPFNYQGNLAYTFAYETANPSLGLALDLNSGIGRIGFYGVNVNFPATVNIGNGGSYKFTVVFVFINSTRFSVFALEEQQVFVYNASFPAYPSLAQKASQVNLKILMPNALSYARSSYEEEGINFTRTTQGSQNVFSYVKSNLSEFSQDSAWVYASRSQAAAQILDVKEVNREIDITGNNEIIVSDSYTALNQAGELHQIQLRVPREAYGISAFVEFGLVSQDNLRTQQTDTHTNVSITFTVPHAEGDEIHLSVQYNLPWSNHVTTGDFDESHVSLSLFENLETTIRRLTVVIALPEGAVPSGPIQSESMTDFQTDPFSSSFTFAFQNATPFHDFALDFTYRRPIFWNSFRPTVWMGAFVIVAGALIGAWRLYQPPPTAPLPSAMVSVRAEDLRSFVNYYDEKRRLQKEAEALDAAARKGKIPRRQYKVRKSTIDGRLSALSRDLAASRDKLRTAGPRYADLMRQLEVAESELQGAEAEITRAEARYRRGDLSAQAYHNVLETAYRRRDKAQTTVDGALLRLREEIS